MWRTLECSQAIILLRLITMTPSVLTLQVPRDRTNRIQLGWMDCEVQQPFLSFGKEQQQFGHRGPQLLRAIHLNPAEPLKHGRES